MILFLVFIGLILLVLSVIAISSIKILRGIDMLRSAVSSGFEFLFAEFEDLEDKLVDDGRFAPYNRSVWANVLHRDTYIDLFVSIHIDSFEEMESVRGTRIYYCTDTPYSIGSKKLCDALAESVKAALPDTNARSFAKSSAEAYVVTKHTEMPSVLIEMGFATNPDDAASILDTEWRDSFCRAIADGIKAYSGN